MPQYHQYDDTTIPTGGTRDNFWKYVQRVTGQRSLKKFVWQGLIFTLFSCFPTIAGSVLRGKVYKGVLGGIGSSCLIEKNVRFNIPQAISLGNRVFIGEGSIIDTQTPKGKIEIKNDVYISQYVIFRAGIGRIFIDNWTKIGTGSIFYGAGGIEVGKNCLLANHVELISGNHVFEDISRPIRIQGGELAKIIIEDDCWLGTHVIVLSGVKIGSGSIIGAGSIVTSDIPPYSVAVGSPARVVRGRGERIIKRKVSQLEQ